jgi:AcrR family transcriptional regulator
MSNDKPSVNRLRDQHAQATRAALIQAAVQRFIGHGHGGTSLDHIAADIGSTKGAVYHHFKDKKALFRAVYEHQSQALIEALVQDPRTQQGAHQAIQAFLDLAGREAYRRVLFVEGPAVLGSQACRDIDLRYSLGLMTALVSQYLPESTLKVVSTEVLTRLLLALLIEAAQLISSAPDAKAMALQVELVLKTGIEALISSLARAP